MIPVAFSLNQLVFLYVYIDIKKIKFSEYEREQSICKGSLIETPRLLEL